MEDKCEVCGDPRPEFAGATKRCNNCWELESRMRMYLIKGGDAAKLFIATALFRSLTSEKEEGVLPVQVLMDRMYEMTRKLRLMFIRDLLGKCKPAQQNRFHHIYPKLDDLQNEKLNSAYALLARTIAQNEKKARESDG